MENKTIIRDRRSSSLCINSERRNSESTPTLPIRIPLSTSHEDKIEKKEKFSLKKFLTPRVGNGKSPSILRKEKSIEVFEKPEKKDRKDLDKEKKSFFFRTNSFSSKKAMESFQISSPMGYTRSFFVSENLTWEFNDKNDLELVQKLGQGGFGTVYKAVHKLSKLVVAVKVIKKENGEITNKDLVEKEMDILKQCQHENLVQYYGFALNENEIWLITKFFENGSVYDVMHTLESPFDEKQIATIIKDVMKGLEYLHNKGFVHRDIKSANILLDSFGNAALADFGSALNKEVSSSVGGGTLAFLAPESVEESLFTFKSDIYALGITCLEMAEMEPPNSNLSSQQLAIKIITEDSPSLKNPKNYSIHFNSFIASCLEKDHEKRSSLSDLLNTSSFLSYALPPKDTMFPKLSIYTNMKLTAYSN